MAKKGYFILTDISGHTEFLTKSELDHAQDALQNLFDVQLAHIKHPFVISGFRGDAIFMYVPETNFCEPQALLESLENLYFVFADALRQMTENTTCTFRACQNMSKLDLRNVWEDEQEKQRFVVTPEEGWLNFEWETAHPLSTVWEYLTTPRL